MSRAMTVSSLVVLCAVMGTTSHADPISQNWHFWVGSDVPDGIFSNSYGLFAGLGAADAPAAPASPAPASPPAVMSSMAAPVSQAAPAAVVVPTEAPVAAPTVYDAKLNFGSGPYPNDSLITTGGAQPWYQSQAIQGLFGGTPTSAQQASFDSTVLQRVEQTFQLSGVPIRLTDDPNASAPHTLSLVSNTSSSTVSNAIGMTMLGGSGFSFIDKIAPSASTVDQLEWIVAHNISHELMLAFNVGENYDQTGNYIDARNANWAMMTDPNATFSSAAAQALKSADFQNSFDQSQQGAQVVGAEPVPEPETILIWGLAALALVLHFRFRKARRPVAALRS
jgi:hypothetical protein